MGIEPMFKTFTLYTNQYRRNLVESKRLELSLFFGASEVPSQLGDDPTMKTITQTCLNPKCQKQFEALVKEVERGNGKYCCLPCSHAHNQSHRKPTLYEIECDHCHKAFESRKQRKAKIRRYCSRLCKDLAHREDCHHARTLAFRNFPHCCNHCGWDKEPAILEVHHKDRDRENNKLENLELLCPTDHCLDHFLAGDGKWSKG